MGEKVLISGSEAVARGFYEAGGDLATGYAGFRITGILNELHKKYKNIYSEISINEKVAVEVSMGASIAGARVITIIDQSGINIMLDSLATFSQSYINGGFIVFIAEDAEGINSYLRHDVRELGKYCGIGIISPSNAQEINDFMKVSLEVSETFNSPIIMIANGYVLGEKSIVNINEKVHVLMKDFIPDQNKYVMFYPYITQVRNRLRERVERLEEYAYECKVNILEEVEGSDTLIITSGSLYNLVKELDEKFSIYKLGMIYPISTKRVKELKDKYSKVIVVEELSSFIEDELKFKGIDVQGRNYFNGDKSLELEDIIDGLTEAGVLQEDIPKESSPEESGLVTIQIEEKVIEEKELGEYSDDLEEIVEEVGDEEKELEEIESNDIEDSEENNNEDKVDNIKEETIRSQNLELIKSLTKISKNPKAINTISRTPVFFPGCPHLPIMKILKDLKALVIGDIGCYTISVYYPWNLSQVNMNSGSSVGLIKGMKKIFYRKGIDKPLVAILGDGVFFHSGMQGIINLLNQYRREESITIIILDNKSIASGEWSESPGAKGSCYYQIKAFARAGDYNKKNNYLDIDLLLKGFGFYDISVVDQFKYKETKGVIKQAIDRPGISFVIAKRPCSISNKIQSAPYCVNNKSCNGCKKCISLHCQAIRMIKCKGNNNEKAYIDPILCNGCSVCSELCPNKSILKN